nr:LuxR family transcriptional regulator [Phytoactinopolyspora mesophila]
MGAIVSQVTGSGRSSTPAKHAFWTEIYDRLGGIDPEILGADDLEALSDAAFWLGRPRESIAARQVGYRKHREAHDSRRATITAWRLFYSYFDLDETSAASGWLQRAHRHALEVPDLIEGRYVALADADWALYNGNLDDALTSARRAGDAGRQFNEGDLEALGLATQGRILTVRGDVAAGLACLDEAMAVTLGNELTPFAMGWICCLLLYTCQELGELRRASEWTDLAVRWCEAKGQDSWYPGLCRLHRSEVQSLHGEWSAAEQEVLRAAEELAPFGDYLVAEGQYLAGEIRRRRGDYASAEDAFRRAHELGRAPQPGLALLRLAKGEARDAAAALRLALASGSLTPVRRARVLSARVDAELALGNHDAATGSADELQELATANRAPYLRALAEMAQGAVFLSKHDIANALPVLRGACDRFRELSCPYETAEVRLMLGVAARESADDETARLEFETAKATFERLGAAPGVARAVSLLGHGSGKPHGLTSREVEVLQLVAHGKSNREISTELVISEHTVARHVSNIFRKLDVTSRSAAASFAYEHHLA